MRQPTRNINKTYHKFIVIITIFFSMVILPCFTVQAGEETPHVHSYETTIITNPTNVEKGFMSMYCAECGDLGYYAIDSESSLNNTEDTQLYFGILHFFLELLMSSEFSLEVSNAITPYSTLAQRFSHAIIGIIALITIYLLTKQSNKEE